MIIFNDENNRNTKGTLIDFIKHLFYKYFSMHRNLYFFVSILVLLLVILNSCEKFENDQTIPAFIQIDTIGFSTEISQQGTASHNITDAWVYVDDQLIGAFEMPAKFPVLAQGNHKVEIRAGIKLNGIAATRVVYPFFKPITLENCRLTPDSVTILNMSTVYYDNTVFPWIEDFESESVSLVEGNNSDTTINITSVDSLVFEGNYSGIIYLDEDKPVFEGVSYEAYILPQLGSPVFIELNYKIENIITAGIYTQTQSQIISSPIVNISKSDKWKKIYINITPDVSSATNALDFKIFFGSVKTDDVENPVILLDNIKLVHKSYSTK